jgi:hypothetical protein
MKTRSNILSNIRLFGSNIRIFEKQPKTYKAEQNLPCINYQSIINYRFKEHFAFVGSESDNDYEDFTAEVSYSSFWVVRRKILSERRSQ